MSAGPPPASRLERIERRALLAGTVLLALAVAGGVLLDDARFFRGYLVGFLFWLGIALGCLAIGMLHQLTGGAWGAALRGALEAGARTLPLMALAFVPLLFGLDELYAWARPDAMDDPLLRHKSVYLNVPFFVARAALYFVTWGLLAWTLTRWRQRDDATEPEPARRLRRLSAGGLVAFGLTVTFALVDWAMSLEPLWYSTIYAGMVATGGLLAALAFAIAVTLVLLPGSPLERLIAPSVLNDLGSLLFAFVMLWTYLAFSQFLLIWAANIREEVPWYLLRTEAGWQYVGLLVMAASFVLPFLALLSRLAKRHRRRLATIAAVIVVVRLVDVYWLVAPPLSAGFSPHLLDILGPLGLGGLWGAVFARQLRTRPLVTPSDVEALREAEAAHG